MSYVQRHPLMKPLPQIRHHEHLPTGAVELGRMTDPSTGRDKIHVLVKHQNHLSILLAYHAGPVDQYYCKQRDFPLRTLCWFPWALEEFRKPPAEGGLHAGAMVSQDMDVDGEMLAVGRTTDGYDLVNRSRGDHGSSNYVPTRVAFSSYFLYDLGFLALWKSLGDKYERGEI